MKTVSFALVVLLAAAGCGGLMTSSQRGLSSTVRQRILSQAVAPEELGIKIIDRGGAKSARWLETVHPSEPVQVPLLAPGRADSSQPSVHVRLNGGKPLAVAIDTGAPVNVIHAQVALANRVRFADPAKLGNTFRGIAGEEQMYFGVVDRLAIGEFEFLNLLTAIRTENFQRRFLGVIPVRRWEGNVLGMSSLLRLAYLTLDYPRGTAVFSGETAFAGPDRTVLAKIPMR